MNQLGTFRREAHVPVNTDKIVGHSRWLGERRDLIRRKHSSIRTEQAYLEWAEPFILFHGKRHPKDMGAQEIVAFLTDPAVARNVAASTQNQALNALVFLYKPQTTLRPGQKGTKGLTQKYGDRLVCVRYRYDQATGRRYTTVELIEEEIVPPSDLKAKQVPQPLPPTQRLGIRVEYWETELRGKIKAAGGLWRPQPKLWEIPYEEVVRLGLEARVVGTVSPAA